MKYNAISFHGTRNGLAAQNGPLVRKAEDMVPISRRNMLYLATASALVRPSTSHTSASQAPSDNRTLGLYKYLEDTVPLLLRPAVDSFPYPSVSPSLPGREYSASLWDWDTLWSCRGLLAYANARRDAVFKAKLLEHCRGSFANFFAHQASDGRLPILMTSANPDLLGSTAPAHPTHTNQAKPVFAQLALLIVKEGGDTKWLVPYFNGILRSYEAWERNNLASCGLFVWGDDVAIGNDNDPTTFGRPFFSSANLLLNCLFYADLLAAADLARKLQRAADAERLQRKAEALGDRIRELCWDPRDQFFYTVDVQCTDHRAELIPQIKPGMRMSWQTLPLRLQTFTGFLPLWCGVATPQQARELIDRNYLADERLRCKSGVRSLSRLETMYSLEFSSNPSNWLGPVWIIANYLVWKGLERYGYAGQASDLAQKTISLLSNDIARNGSMNEYYHPDTGAPLSHKGFMDWNLLVNEMVRPGILKD